MNDLREPVETVETDAATVDCDGDDDALGHPLVYLQVGAEGQVDCPYCGRRFIRGPGAAAGH